MACVLSIPWHGETSLALGQLALTHAVARHCSQPPIVLTCTGLCHPEDTLQEISLGSERGDRLPYTARLRLVTECRSSTYRRRAGLRTIGHDSFAKLMSRGTFGSLPSGGCLSAG